MMTLLMSDDLEWPQTTSNHNNFYIWHCLSCLHSEWMYRLNFLVRL